MVDTVNEVNEFFKASLGCRGLAVDAVAALAENLLQLHACGFGRAGFLQRIVGVLGNSDNTLKYSLL